MVQEDLDPRLIRIEELERQRDVVQAAMPHMNQVHVGTKADFEQAMGRLEEWSQMQHARDQEIAVSLS